MSNKVSVKDLFSNAKPKLHPEEIEWEGNSATVNFQRLTMEESADLANQFMNADGSALDKARIKDYQAAVIAAVVRDELGAKFLTADEVKGWDGAFFMAVNKAAEKQNPQTEQTLEAVAKNS